MNRRNEETINIECEKCGKWFEITDDGTGTCPECTAKNEISEKEKKIYFFPTDFETGGKYTRELKAGFGIECGLISGDESAEYPLNLGGIYFITDSLPEIRFFMGWPEKNYMFDILEPEKNI